MSDTFRPRHPRDIQRHRPSKEQLFQELLRHTYCEVAHMHKVGYYVVVQWCRELGLPEHYSDWTCKRKIHIVSKTIPLPNYAIVD